jgi:hypothetical protein
MNIYYRFIRNNQDYKKALSIFYEMNYHWSSLIPTPANVKNSYIFGVDSYLRFGCRGCKLNDFKKTILEHFKTHSAIYFINSINFINLKTNSVLELG